MNQTIPHGKIMHSQKLVLKQGSRGLHKTSGNPIGNVNYTCNHLDKYQIGQLSR